MEQIQNRTEVNGRPCVKFVEKLKDQKNGYVKIIDDIGCYSSVGKLTKLKYLPQDLSLEKSIGCVDSRRIIAHELLHVLGLHHEHERADRDQWIHINLNNISEPFLMLQSSNSN